MLVRLLVSALVVFGCSSCVLVPFIDSYKNMGFSKSDRIRLFDDRLQEYNYAMSDGSAGKMVRFVPEEMRNDFRKELRGELKARRIVDTKVDLVEFDDEGQVAEAEVLVRYYRIPQYVVKQEIEGQRWEFSLTEGWQLMSRELIEADAG